MKHFKKIAKLIPFCIIVILIINIVLLIHVTPILGLNVIPSKLRKRPDEG